MLFRSYSFFLTTDQIKTPQKEKEKEKEIQDVQINKLNIKSDDEEVTNKFSEVNASEVNFEDYQ